MGIRDCKLESPSAFEDKRVLGLSTLTKVCCVQLPAQLVCDNMVEQSEVC